MSAPVLHVIAGPNGSGKSTLAERVLLPATGLPFVNADRIAASLWDDPDPVRAYEAAHIAAALRRLLIERRRSFVTETVLSRPDKVELLRDAAARGYRVELHVTVVPLELAVARVADRVRRGGHEVPEEKVRTRYERLWPLVVRAREIADVATLYDNSDASAALRRFARYTAGQLTAESAWPGWVPAVLR